VILGALDLAPSLRIYVRFKWGLLHGATSNAPSRSHRFSRVDNRQLSCGAMDWGLANSALIPKMRPDSLSLVIHSIADEGSPCPGSHVDRGYLVVKLTGFPGSGIRLLSEEECPRQCRFRLIPPPQRSSQLAPLYESLPEPQAWQSPRGGVSPSPCPVASRATVQNFGY